MESRKLCKLLFLVSDYERKIVLFEVVLRNLYEHFENRGNDLSRKSLSV